jgi:hypothetical protein
MFWSSLIFEGSGGDVSLLKNLVTGKKKKKKKKGILRTEKIQSRWDFRLLHRTYFEFVQNCLLGCTAV